MVFSDCRPIVREEFEKLVHEKAKWFGRCQEIVAEDAVNGFLFLSPALSAMKAELMGWWKNYPTIALDCTEVWWKK